MFWRVGTGIALALALAEVRVRWTANYHRVEVSPLPKALENRFFQNAEGLWLRWYKWSAPGTARATLVIAHGLGEYVTREQYQIVARHLNKMGIDVYGLDHQGHGMSHGERHFVADFDNIPKDLLQFVRERVNPGRATAGTSSKPLFILGHSMGGAVAARAIAMDPSVFDAAVLSGPAFSHSASPVEIALGQVFQKYLPRMALTKLPVDTISRNLDVNFEYSQDPLCNHEALKARLGIGILLAQDSIRRDHSKYTLPFLILHGDGDKLVPVEGSKEFYEKAATPAANKRLKVYSGMFHEVFEDDEQATVLKDLSDFLEEQLKK